MAQGGIRCAADPVCADVVGIPQAGGRIVKSQKGSPWTDEKVAQLTRLFDEKLSSSIIAGLLGVTRNSVIGRLHRMGFQKPKPEVRLARMGNHKKSDGRPRTDGTVVQFRPRPEKFAERAAVIVPMGLTLLELEPHHCRFPYGDGPFTFCGHKKMRGSSYCPDHFNLTWMPTRPRT